MVKESMLRVASQQSPDHEYWPIEDGAANGTNARWLISASVQLLRIHRVIVAPMISFTLAYERSSLELYRVVISIKGIGTGTLGRRHIV